MTHRVDGQGGCHAGAPDHARRETAVALRESYELASAVAFPTLDDTAQLDNRVATLINLRNTVSEKTT